MFYTIYKITNLINNHYYIGKHKTKNIDDSYMGSGKIIKLAIKKYGLNNFHKSVLELCYSEEHMNKREKEILTQEHVSNANCYNCRVGGEGGWGHWLGTEEAYQSRLKGGKNSGVRERNLALSKEEFIHRYEKGLKKWLEENPIDLSSYWTEEKRQLQAIKIIGDKNPMYGKCWVCSPDGKPELIDEKYLSMYEEKGWSKGKKIKDKTKGSYGRCWVNKDGVSKFIKKDDMSSWVKNGWLKGRIMSDNSIKTYFKKSF